jgi:hypothetical protein
MSSFQSGKVLALLVLRFFVDGSRGADSRDHVFALGIHEVFAVEDLFAGGRDDA